MRYLEWSWDPDPTDSTCTTDYTYVLRESDGSITVVHDRHIEGMFPRDTWLRLFRQAGFEPGWFRSIIRSSSPARTRSLYASSVADPRTRMFGRLQAARRLSRRPRRHRRARRFAC